MKNSSEQQNKGFLSSLIGERTHAKTAGLTYTVAALAIFCVSFFLIILISASAMSENTSLYLNYLAAPIAFLLVGAWYFSYTKTPQLFVEAFLFLCVLYAMRTKVDVVTDTLEVGYEVDEHGIVFGTALALA